MKIRVHTLLLTTCLVCACSFDRTFFPIDKRPGDSKNRYQEIIVLPSADGKNIDHFLIKPQSDPDATIFVFHGSGSTVANWTTLLNPLTKDGFQLFLMEYRGFGNSEGHATHESVVADAHRAFLYLIGRKDVKDKPILVLGQSYGGQLAISVGARYPQEVDALVIEGTFTSFRDIAVYSTPWIGKPFTWAFFRNPYDSANVIRKATMPKLIIHSREDGVVPFAMGEELFRHAGDYKEFWEINGKHAHALADYPTEFVARIRRLARQAHNP